MPAPIETFGRPRPAHAAEPRRDPAAMRAELDRAAEVRAARRIVAKEQREAAATARVQREAAAATSAEESLYRSIYPAPRDAAVAETLPPAPDADIYRAVYGESTTP